jgi:hypothetical protein
MRGAMLHTDEGLDSNADSPARHAALASGLKLRLLLTGLPSWTLRARKLIFPEGWGKYLGYVDDLKAYLATLAPRGHPPDPEDAAATIWLDIGPGSPFR